MNILEQQPRPIKFLPMDHFSRRGNKKYILLRDPDLNRAKIWFLKHSKKINPKR